MLPEKYRFILHTILCFVGYLATAGAAWAFPEAEIVAVDYPQVVAVGDDLRVTLTVRNAGSSLWEDVCASVRYRFRQGDSAVDRVNTCCSLGVLEPGQVDEFSCDAGEPVAGLIEKAWAGVGMPLG